MFVFISSSRHSFSEFLDLFQKAFESEKDYGFVSGLFNNDHLQKDKMHFMKIVTIYPGNPG